MSHQSHLTFPCIYPFTRKWGWQLCLSPGDLEENFSECIASSNLRSGQGPDLFTLCWGLGMWWERGELDHVGEVSLSVAWVAPCVSASSWRHGPVKASTAWVLSALLTSHCQHLPHRTAGQHSSEGQTISDFFNTLALVIVTSCLPKTCARIIWGDVSCFCLIHFVLILSLSTQRTILLPLDSDLGSAPLLPHLW